MSMGLKMALITAVNTRTNPTFAKNVKLQKCDGTTLKAGDICTICANVFDSTGRTFNPPQVLILESPDHYGLVRVSQLFEWRSLASQGDIYTGLDSPCFYAEAWNVYGMHVDHLSVPTMHIKSTIADLIFQVSQQPFLPIAINGPLWQFRQCELNTGSYFSMPSVFYALDRLEK